MKAYHETGLCPVAHLYQIRTLFFPTFQVFFKLCSVLVLAQIDYSKRFKFFFHIDRKIGKNVIQIMEKSNTLIVTLEVYLISMNREQ